MFITRGTQIIKECVGYMIDSFDWNVIQTESESDKAQIAEFFGVEESDSIEFYTRFV